MLGALTEAGPTGSSKSAEGSSNVTSSPRIDILRGRKRKASRLQPGFFVEPAGSRIERRYERLSLEPIADHRLVRLISSDTDGGSFSKNIGTKITASATIAIAPTKRFFASSCISLHPKRLTPHDIAVALKPFDHSCERRRVYHAGTATIPKQKNISLLNSNGYPPTLPKAISQQPGARGCSQTPALITPRAHRMAPNDADPPRQS
jgi:hypothetical protein